MVTYPNFNGYRYICVSQSIQTNGSWGGWTYPVIYSLKPDPGDPEPAIVYRGLFASTVYYNKAEQKQMKKLREDYLPRLEKYEEQLEKLGDRNSYSKTDEDATFMRMKEEHMKKRSIKTRLQRTDSHRRTVHNQCRYTNTNTFPDG
jgi:hypothetical protein